MACLMKWTNNGIDCLKSDKVYRWKRPLKLRGSLYYCFQVLSAIFLYAQYPRSSGRNLRSLEAGRADFGIVNALEEIP